VSRNGSPDEKPNMSITATLGWRRDAITSRLRVGFTVSVMPFLFFRRDVALARPRLESPLRHSHVDAVRFAVVFGRRVAEEILTVELAPPRGEARAETRAEANLRVAAAGLLGDACEPRVGQVFEQRRLESTGTDSGTRWVCAPAAQADGVHHHGIAARAVDDLGLADDRLPETDRAAILAVAQHQDDRALVALV